MGRSLLLRGGTRGAWLMLALAGLITALGACSAIVDPDIEELGPPPAACSSGTIRSCVCSGGLTGTQRCTASGAFTSCECARPAGSGAAGRGGAGAGAGAGGAGSGSAGAAGRQGRGM